MKKRTRLFCLLLAGIMLFATLFSVIASCAG